jgi:hypothetical protein
MKRTLISIALFVAMLGTPVLAQQDEQGEPRGITVECWQSGRIVTEVPLSTDFEIRGTGFNPDYPVWICVATDVCLPAEVDLTGSFTQHRLLQVPGKHTITITQGPNHGLESWVPRARMLINVTN